MTQYAVVSSDEAEDQLTLIWLSAKDRTAITSAQNQIDKALAKDPRQAGAEVSEGLWRIQVPPLKAFYEIDDPQRIVRITGIGRTV